MNDSDKPSRPTTNDGGSRDSHDEENVVFTPNDDVHNVSALDEGDGAPALKDAADLCRTSTGDQPVILEKNVVDDNDTNCKDDGGGGDDDDDDDEEIGLQPKGRPQQQQQQQPQQPQQQPQQQESPSLAQSPSPTPMATMVTTEAKEAEAALGTDGAEALTTPTKPQPMTPDSNNKKKKKKNRWWRGASSPSPSPSPLATSSPSSSTPDTKSPKSMMTSPTLSSPSSPSSPADRSYQREPHDVPRYGPQVVTIEHKIDHESTNSKKKDGKRAARVMAFMRRPVVIVVGLIGLAVTGAAAWGWFTIPGLNDQIERLEAQVVALELQVDRLEGQVDRLENEIDRLGGEVNRLSNETTRYELINDLFAGNLTEYENQNIILNETVVRYDRINDELNDTVTELTRINQDLEENSEEYRAVNEQLTNNVLDLSTEVEHLIDIQRELQNTNDELIDNVYILTNRTRELTDLNADLNRTVQNLEVEVTDLRSEVDRLDILTTNLVSVVSFLDETADDIDGSLDNFTSYLASQTDFYRGLVLRTVENLYRQQSLDWDCDLRSRFATESFVAEGRDEPIGPTHYPDVMSYLDTRVLSVLCLDRNDFETIFLGMFLLEEQGQTLLPPDDLDDGGMNIALLPDPSLDLTLNQLLQAVTIYTTSARDYYFPEDGEMGLSSIDWADAGYECENLPPEKTFRV